MLCWPDLRVCLQVVGLYRLCGSAAVKKELREAFERDSYAVELCENMYPDVNVITGSTKSPDHSLIKWSFLQSQIRQQTTFYH